MKQAQAKPAHVKPAHIAVIDIGKTNAKLVLVDTSDLSEIDVVTIPNTVIDAKPWPHFDIEAIWAFLLKGLRDFHVRHGIDAIVTTTHGASAALLAADGSLAAPILDYEFTGLHESADEYDRLRATFDQTGSPRLAAGLNIGAQLHWQFKKDPSLLGRTQTIVTYPQYWGHRLTGVVATDITSLGCHSDLWNPHKQCFSSLVETLGITDKMAPVRKPSEILGPLLPDVAEQTGLSTHTPVFCGIHDSNASLLPHILCNTPPFSVVSTGTWVIAMSIGGKQVVLDPDKDTLVNVNALGNATPSARFMGGREYELATQAPYPEPTDKDLENVLRDRIMLLPALVPETGPFQGMQATWRDNIEPAVGTAQRGAAVALYLALVSSHCLELIGHEGPVIVEGPFTNNRMYLDTLADVTRSRVLSSVGLTGTGQGAAMLAGEVEQWQVNDVEIRPRDDVFARDIRAYADSWQTIVQQAVDDSG